MTTIRPATLADLPALGRLGALLVGVHHDFDPQRFLPARAGTQRGYAGFLAGEIERDGAVVLAADEAGEVIGYVYGSLEGHDWMALRGPAGVIHDLVVDPTRRGQGIGARLLGEAVAALTAIGAPRLVLATAARNEAARRLFDAAGFRPTMIEMTRELP